MSWQPIETAPKDGTSVLLFGRYFDEPAVGHWSPRDRGWMATVDGSRAIEHQSDFGTTYVMLDPVTHWMPLPDPPADQTDEIRGEPNA